MSSRRADRRRSKAKSASSGEQETAGSLARFILTVAIIAWMFRAFAFAAFNIPSGSMLPTLYIGDYLAVAKWPYGFSRYSLPFGFPSFDGQILGHLPQRGDVVVFRHPVEDNDLIKRVIGLPGDTIAVRDGRVILNGRLVLRRALPPSRIAITANSPCRTIPPSLPHVVAVGDQGYCLYPAYLETLPGGRSYTVLDQVDQGIADNFAPVTVPAGHVFLMGDNRDDSLDSRFPTFQGGVAMVPVENLIGRAQFTFWSTDGSASWFLPWTWFSSLRPSRLGNGYNGVAE